MTQRYQAVWTDVALTDLLALIDYVVGHSGVAASQNLHERVIGAVDALETLPLRCRVVPELHAEGIETYREEFVGPYRIVFAVHGDDVVVLAVVDGRRDLAELLIERALRQP